MQKNIKFRWAKALIALTILALAISCGVVIKSLYRLRSDSVELIAEHKAAEARAKAESDLIRQRQEELVQLRRDSPPSVTSSEKLRTPGDPRNTNPEYLRLEQIQIRASIETGYGLLFRRLKLSQLERSKVRQLLIDRATKAPSRDRESESNYIRELQQLLGADRFNTFASYEQMLPQYRQVDQFARQLRITPNALSDEQVEILSDFLHEQKLSLSDGTQKRGQTVIIDMDEGR